MSNIQKFYENGFLTINVDYEAIEGSPLVCLENGLWYKFKIGKVEELDNNTYNITTTELMSIDDKLITK